MINIVKKTSLIKKIKKKCRKLKRKNRKNIITVSPPKISSPEVSSQEYQSIKKLQQLQSYIQTNDVNLQDVLNIPETTITNKETAELLDTIELKETTFNLATFF